MSRRADCQRLAELTDARAVGEVLGAEDERFLSQHLVTCAQCRRQEALFDALARHGEDGADAIGPSIETREVEPALALPLRIRKRTMVGAGAVALVCAAAAAAAFVVAGPGGDDVPIDTSSAGSEKARVVLATGAAVDALASVRDGVPDGTAIAVDEGRLCLRIDADVTACFAAQTRARLDLAAVDARTIVLERGGLSVDVVPNVGRGLHVRTAQGTFEVVGTVFSVRSDVAESQLAVSHGRVRARHGSRSEEVGAGEVLTLSRDGGVDRGAYPTSLRERDAALLRGADLYRDGESAVLILRDAPGCNATVDGVEIGAGPLWMRVAPAEREVALGGPCARQRRVRFTSGEALVLDEGVTIAGATTARASATAPGSATALPAHPSAEVAVTPAATGVTPMELLTRAQDLRREGRAADALATYEELTVRHPASPEAQAARISVGQLKLAMGNPRGALAELERYLARGGALSQEAETGRIACLRALGRTGEEASAIRSFLAAHPDAVQAKTLRARLGEIAPAGGD